MPKSDLSKVLAYSLTVGQGKADNIRLGSTEAWLPEKAVPSAYGARDAFQALVQKVKALEGDISALGGPLPEPLRKQAKALADAITRVKTETHALAYDDRSALTQRIAALDEDTGALARAVADERTARDDRARLPVPVITVAAAEVEFRTNAAVTLAGFKAASQPPVPLRLVLRNGEAIPPGGFAQASPRALSIVADATGTTQAASLPVVARIVARPRELSVPQEVREFEWGVTITPQALGVTAKGGGVPVITNPEVCAAIGEQTLMIAVAAEGEWGAAKGTARVRILPATRVIDWTLPAMFRAGETITPQMLGVRVSLAGNGVVVDDARPRVTAPAGQAFKAAGPGQDLAVTCAATRFEKEVTRTAKVDVVRQDTSIAWNLPSSLAKGEALPAGAAAITPAALQAELVLAPAAGAVQNRIGPLTVRATYAGSAIFKDASSEARILVIEAARMIAGAKAANEGKALKTPVGSAKLRLDDWNNSDPNDPAAIGTMGKRLMHDVSGMDSAGVKAFIAREAANNAEVRKLENKVLGDGTPMVILSFRNGLEIRHKDDGGPRYGNKPTVSIEVRNDPALAVSTSQADIAFKLTMTGEPGPKGPEETLVPAGVNINDFKDGAMKATHLVLQ